MAKKPAPKPKTKAAPKPKRKPKNKSWNGNTANIWTPMGSSAGVYPFGSSDIYGSQPIPTPIDLLNAYEDIVYSCVKYISDQIGKYADKVKLCVATRPGDQKARSLTRQLDYAAKKSISAKYTKYTRRAVEIDEVTDHPILDLVDRPNPRHSWSNLLGMADIYLELVGSAFLYKARDDYGQVTELWLLESQFVQIETDDYGITIAYLYKRGEDTHRYDPEDIIHIQFDDPTNPYGGMGRSPVRAVWQRVQLLRQEQSSWQAVLANMAFPSALIFPPAEQDGTGTFTADQAQRLSRQISERFRQGNQGGPWVVQDRIDYQPLTTPPKDVTALTMYDQIRTTVCAAYGVPRSLIDSTYSTADSDTVKRAFQETSLQPRLDMILDTFNHQLIGGEATRVSRLTGRELTAPRRLFLCIDDIVQPDRAYELQRQASIGTLVAGNIVTQNEARQKLDLEPTPDGNKFMYQLQPTKGDSLGVPSLPSAIFDRAVKSRTKNYKSTPPNPQLLSEKLSDIFRRLGDDVLAKFKTSTDLTTKAVIPLTDWTDIMKRELVPVLHVYAEEGAEGIMQELVGSLRTLPVQSLDIACERAALHLAESTLSTTTLSVEAAVSDLREQIRQGLDQGEGTTKLRDRVKEIFTTLSDERSVLIAETESSRMKHSGELIAIKDSGVDCQKVWLADSLACDICKKLNGVTKSLNEPFLVTGNGPYGVVDHPPGHPRCRCSQQYTFPEGA